MKPLYSICMCNYNMADTLERSLSSLLMQLDERFEIVVVDDGSSDTSVEIVRQLQRDVSSLRLVVLPRDARRRLGTTRNISIREARGEYVLLHLDCDDVFGPHIVDFVNVFHRIDECLGGDILVAGRHINIASRQFLLGHGPYRNIHMVEDLDMLRRLAVADALVILNHVDFIRRLPKDRVTRTRKAIVDTFSRTRENCRIGWTGREIMAYCRGTPGDSLQLRLFKVLSLLPAWMMALRDGPISKVKVSADYRERVSGTYADIMRRHGGDPSLSFLSKQAQRIFAAAS